MLLQGPVQDLQTLLTSWGRQPLQMMGQQEVINKPEVLPPIVMHKPQCTQSAVSDIVHLVLILALEGQYSMRKHALGGCCSNRTYQEIICRFTCFWACAWLEPRIPRFWMRLQLGVGINHYHYSWWLFWKGFTNFTFTPLQFKFNQCYCYVHCSSASMNISVQVG